MKKMKKYITPELTEEKLTLCDTMTASPASEVQEFDNYEEAHVSLFRFFDE